MRRLRRDHAMKTDLDHSRSPRRSQDGFAVMIILVLLTILVVLAAANTATVNRLRDRVKIVDQSQTRRLAASSTNQAAAK
jgi:Tfp pilus assembly protein PilX